MKIARKFSMVLLMMALIVTIGFSSAMARDNDRGIAFNLFSSGSSGGFSGGGGSGGGGGARSVPEPSTLILLASGVGGLILVHRMRNRR